MLYNYLKLYFRSFLKKKSISIVTIGGLALGMATSLLILGYISSELSFDRFHSNKDRIYRMIWEYGNKNYTTRLQPIAGERIKNEIASVEDAIRFFPQSATMTIDEGNSDPEVFKADEVLYVDPSFFQVFNFPVHNGDQNPFEDPYSMVMTRSAAKRYFEDEDPVGKRINLRNMFGSVDYTLTAVVEDIPDNSSIRFEILTTNERLFSDAVGYLGIQSWGAFDTFILTQSGDVDIQEIESTVKEMVDDMDSEYGSILFQPIEDIHLGSAFLNDGSQGMTRIYAFSSIAVIIMILAWFNFINISSARSLERLKESGIRKVLGSENAQVLRQFLFDATLTNVIAFLLAFAFVEIIDQGLIRYTQITINPIESIKPVYLLTLGLLFIAGIGISAFAPFLLIRKIKPYEALNFNSYAVGPGAFLRQALTFIQFSVSFFLLAFTFFVYQQVHFMENKEMGFGMEKTLIVSAPDNPGDDMQVRIQSFGNRLKDTNWFQSISVSSAVPGKGYNYGTVCRKAGSPEDENFEIKVTYIDTAFIDHYKIKLSAGNTFRNAPDPLSPKIMINEAAAGLLGFNTAGEAIGQKIELGSMELQEVVGVIEDYHHASLHSVIEPAAFLYTETGNSFSIKYDAEQESDVLAYVESLYNEFFPLNAFEYVFLDQLFADNYMEDKRFGRLFILFSFVALMIASMGLYGITELNAQKKVKEIGIRKVLGATSLQIFKYLSRHSLVMISIAYLTAIPLVIYVGTRWLDNFAYKTGFVFYPVLIPYLLILTLSLVVISFKVINASTANPVESLRYE